MSISDKIMKEIEMLNEDERQKVLMKIKEKYMSDVIFLGGNYAWWDNKEDDIYNEK